MNYESWKLIENICGLFNCPGQSIILDRTAMFHFLCILITVTKNIEAPHLFIVDGKYVFKSLKLKQTYRSKYHLIS
jgi:hypothetical protein